MQDVLSAVATAFALISLGYGLRLWAFRDGALWLAAEKLTYVLFLPALLFRSVASAEALAWQQAAMVLLAAAAIMLLQSIGAFALWRTVLRRMNRAAFASFHQGTVRFNNYIGIPVVVAAASDHGLALYGIIIALAIPLSNILTIAVMAWAVENRTRRTSLRFIAAEVLRNPLVIGSGLGVLVLVSGQGNLALWQPVDALARAALPVGLLCVGASIRLQGVAASLLPLGVACVYKLLLAPAVMLALSLAAGLPVVLTTVLTIFAGLPCASSCHIVSRAMGADVSLMARMTAAQTLLSLASLPLLFFIIEWFFK